MTVVVTHSTPADGTFSATGATAWNADHTLSGVGTMAGQDANAVAITGGSISGVSGIVTSVTGTAPVVSSGGTTPAISMAAATALVNGYLTSTDWSTFNGKGSGSVTSVAGTGTVSGISLSGTVTSSGSLTLGGTLDLSSPPAIGSTAANTGAFTTLSASSTVSGTGFSTYLASPPAIGGTAAAAGAFTTLSASSTVSGTGFSTYLASPPAIGGTTAAAGSFTTVTATTVNIAASAANAGLTLLRDTGTATRSSRIFLDASSGVCAIYNSANSILFNTSATIGSSSGTNQFLVFHTASAVDYVQVTGGTTVTKTVTVSAQGSDTDVDLALVPKGAGRVTVSTSIKPKVSSAANVTSPLAWNSTSFDEYAITALANALTISADANASPADGQRMMFRFKDNGTARALTWTTGSTNSFRVVGVTLPTTTVASKLVYIGCIYNAADSRWDAVAVSQEA